MKPFKILFSATAVLFSSTLLGVCFAEIKVGDSLQTVYDELGTPRAYIRYATTELLSFDRGRVELRNGAVVLAQVLSEEEAEALRLQQQAEAEQRRAIEQERRARLLAEGQVVLESKLADANFLKAPAVERVSYWQNFRSRYPDVPPPNDYSIALGEHAVELARQAEQTERERRIADLETRVRDAEDRARRAEDEARYANSSRYVVGAYYPYGYNVGGYYSAYPRVTSRSTCYPAASGHGLRSRNFNYARPVTCAPVVRACRPVQAPCSTTVVRPASLSNYCGSFGRSYARLSF